MTANFDEKGFDLFVASFSTSQGVATREAALDAWFRMSYHARLSWGQRAANPQKPKWLHLNVRLSVDDHTVLMAKAARDKISLSDLVRLIMVDAVLDERERAERLAAREPRQSAASPAGSDSQPSITVA